MERYLEEKYSRRFHVDQPVHKSSGFAVEGTYVANAYPLDNPELTFEVTKSSRVSNDKYVAALWTTDARTYVDSIIKEAFGYLPEYKLLIATHPGEDGSIKGEVPPFADGIKRYGAQVAVNVTVKSADVVGDRQIAVRAHTVVERLVVMGFGSAAIRYTDSSGTSLTYGVGAAASELEAQPHKTVEEIIREIRR
ncbi:hypothetical protein CR983_03680 [Candidatus Saccharibacteria bacterium]|nr:MAG: hypothetical protein CR983_03680 [Candidatus Saccharibacteria bacterium]